MGGSGGGGAKGQSPIFGDECGGCCLPIGGGVALITTGKGFSIVRFFVPRGPLAVLVTAAALIAPGVAQADYQPIRGTDFFSPTSVWNQPLLATAPIASYSKTYVDTLNQEVTTYGPWINTTSYSFPVYTIPSTQPNVFITLDTPSAPLQAMFQSVPLPAGARPANGTDQNLVIWQPSTQTMWEFFRLHQDLTGAWHASWGGKMTNVNTNPGYYANGFGATATGLAAVGGLMTLQEESDGVINHALAVALPHPMAGVFVAPAQRTDGDTSSWSAIPEGMRFRLPSSLNIDALNLPRQTAMMAKAVQRYGMIIRDKAGAVAFMAEDPYLYTQKYGIDPYGPYAFQGRYPSQLLASFPWKSLQVVQP